jgi:hypothetical protein
VPLSDPIAASDALHDRAGAMISAYELGRPLPETFEHLAADLARFQAARVPGYARLCAARGFDPNAPALESAGRAPAVPADAFKSGRVFAFDDGAASIAFRTSGTTLGARGLHSMRHARTYDAAALAFGRRKLLGGLPFPSPVLVLGPSAKDAPDSSLAHMCSTFARTFGGGDDDAEAYVAGGAIAVDRLRARAAGLDPRRPAVVLATSFALVHLLDGLGGRAVPLPPGSRVMQTGGFKGRSREVSPADLRRAVAHAFAIDERAVVGEYGMTELSSQFWEATAVDPRAPVGVYVEPPWARVVPVDGETLEPVGDAAVGIARIEDLANIDSAWAVLTHDRVRRVPGGFELLGRSAGAPPRGCSIALDEMLSAST